MVLHNYQFKSNFNQRVGQHFEMAKNLAASSIAHNDLKYYQIQNTYKSSFLLTLQGHSKVKMMVFDEGPHVTHFEDKQETHNSKSLQDKGCQNVLS